MIVSRSRNLRFLFSNVLTSATVNDSIPQGPCWFGEPKMQQARCWIENCLSNHNTCKQTLGAADHQNVRPKRVLELQLTGTVAIRQSEELPELYDYVTLSHMWDEHPEK